jgi:tripartite-type tricarboxylate transporter receptor subunit TctC
LLLSGRIKMRIRNLRPALVAATTALLLAAVGSMVRAADFPNKPIQLIVPYSAGGSTDVLARAISQVAPKDTSKEIVAYLEAKFKAVAADPEFQKIMKDLGQPVLYQDAKTYDSWFKAAYDQYGSLIKRLGVETK